MLGRTGREFVEQLRGTAPRHKSVFSHFITPAMRAVVVRGEWWRDSLLCSFNFRSFLLRYANTTCNTFKALIYLHLHCRISDLSELRPLVYVHQKTQDVYFFLEGDPAQESPVDLVVSYHPLDEEVPETVRVDPSDPDFISLGRFFTCLALPFCCSL